MEIKETMYKINDDGKFYPLDEDSLIEEKKEESVEDSFPRLTVEQFDALASQFLLNNPDITRIKLLQEIQNVMELETLIRCFPIVLKQVNCKTLFNNSDYRKVIIRTLRFHQNRMKAMTKVFRAKPDKIDREVRKFLVSISPDGYIGSLLIKKRMYNHQIERICAFLKNFDEENILDYISKVYKSK